MNKSSEDLKTKQIAKKRLMLEIRELKNKRSANKKFLKKANDDYKQSKSEVNAKLKTMRALLVLVNSAKKDKNHEEIEKLVDPLMDQCSYLAKHLRLMGDSLKRISEL